MFVAVAIALMLLAGCLLGFSINLAAADKRFWAETGSVAMVMALVAPHLPRGEHRPEWAVVLLFLFGLSFVASAYFLWKIWQRRSIVVRPPDPDDGEPIPIEEYLDRSGGPKDRRFRFL